MALTNTLADLRTLVRQRADMVGSDFLADAEVNGYINSSLAEMHDLLVTTFEDYLTTGASLTVSTSGTATLPANFMKLRSLCYVSGSQYIPLRAVAVADLWRYRMGGASIPPGDRRYLLMGANINVYPTERAAGTYEILYVKRYTPLTSDSDVPFSDSGVPDEYWDEYVVVDAAIKCLQKEESDVSVLMAQKQALRMRIINAASARDSAEPAHILDVDSNTPAWPWWSV